jgi:hypothetical protein
VARIKAQLDRSLGRGNYVLAITADHGQQPLPDVFGGWRINSNELARDIEERFGADIVQKITTVDIFMNMENVESSGVELADVARYVGTYTIGENIRAEQPGEDLVPEAMLDDRLFAGAFSTGFLQDLTLERVQSLGDGDYPEGRLGMAEPSS